MESTAEPARPQVADIVRHVADDLKTIATDEVELARSLLAATVGRMLAKASITLLGAMVALIGFAMLCTAAVVALEPVIGSLAVRLVVMAAIYVAVGAAVAAYYARQLAKQPEADLHRPVAELKDTVDAIQEGLSH